MYKCSNSCLWCSCWWNLDFSFKRHGKESLYKYCMNVDDGRIMRSWRSWVFFLLVPTDKWPTHFTCLGQTLLSRPVIKIRAKTCFSLLVFISFGSLSFAFLKCMNCFLFFWGYGIVFMLYKKKNTPLLD